MNENQNGNQNGNGNQNENENEKSDARKAGDWAGDYVERGIKFENRVFWDRVKYGILNFVVSWIPISYLKYMARSAIRDMVEEGAKRAKSKKADAEQDSNQNESLPR